MDTFGAISGGQSLEASGAYTPEFGQAVFQSFNRSSSRCQQEAQSMLERLRSKAKGRVFFSNREALSDEELELRR